MADDPPLSPELLRGGLILPEGRTGHALIIGGTRGIGAALVRALQARGWNAVGTGRADFDIADPATWQRWLDAHPGSWDLVAFCAGELNPCLWQFKSMPDYMRAYAVHAAGPVAWLAENRDLVPWWAIIIFISTVGATNAGAVDLGYGMAKASLHKLAKTLAGNEAWRIVLVELDLVNTRMLAQLPPDSLHGRPVMEPDEAAAYILSEAGL